MITMHSVLSFLLLSSLEKRFTGWEATSREETSLGPYQQKTHLSGGNPRGLTVLAEATLSPGKVITPWFRASHLTLTKRPEETQATIVPGAQWMSP